MAGRGPQSFKKRQKEQQRKEKQADKKAKMEKRKADKEAGILTPDEDEEDDFDDSVLDRYDPNADEVEQAAARPD